MIRRIMRALIGLVSALRPLLLCQRIQARKGRPLLAGLFRLICLGVSLGQGKVDLRAIGTQLARSFQLRNRLARIA